MKPGVLPAPVQYLVVAGFLIVSVLVEGRWGHQLVFHGARPDPCVVVVGASASLLGWRRGAVFGLIGGLLSAALVPVNFGTQIISYTLGGVITGWIPVFIAADSPAISPVAGIVCTATVGISSMLMAPSHHLHVWALHFVGELVLNTVLTIPIFYLLRFLRIGIKQRPSLFST